MYFKSGKMTTTSSGSGESKELSANMIAIIIVASLVILGGLGYLGIFLYRKWDKNRPVKYNSQNPYRRY